MNANPCSKCGSDKIVPKHDTATNMAHMHCEKCNHNSADVPMTQGNDAIIAKWNEENPKTMQSGETAKA